LFGPDIKLTLSPSFAAPLSPASQSSTSSAPEPIQTKAEEISVEPSSAATTATKNQHHVFIDRSDSYLQS
jgi:hypothetical protein